MALVLASHGVDVTMSAVGAPSLLMADDRDNAGSSARPGWHRLLARLDPDVDRAAAAYEHLRRALEKFFDWRGVWSADECADETLDRLARRLDEGVDIADVRNYAYGIARLVLLEWQRRPSSVWIGPDSELAAPPVAAGDAGDRLRECFDGCLAALPEDSRVLVLEYYVADERKKIENRRRLARSFAISENALRSRVQRIRDRLERCVLKCEREAARRRQ